MKCPRCGSGNTRGQRLGNEHWLRRWFCNECHHAWVDQIGPRPPQPSGDNPPGESDGA